MRLWLEQPISAVHNALEDAKALKQAFMRSLVAEGVAAILTGQKAPASNKPRTPL